MTKLPETDLDFGISDFGIHDNLGRMDNLKILLQFFSKGDNFPHVCLFSKWGLFLQEIWVRNVSEIKGHDKPCILMQI